MNSGKFLSFSEPLFPYLENEDWDFPGSPMVETSRSQCRGHRLMPGQGSKISHTQKKNPGSVHLLLNCSKDVSQGWGLSWDSDGEGTTSKFTWWFSTQFFTGCQTEKRISAPSWMLAGDHPQSLAMWVSPYGGLLHESQQGGVNRESLQARQ